MLLIIRVFINILKENISTVSGSIATALFCAEIILDFVDL